MKWAVMTHAPDGVATPTGEGSDSLGQAKGIAREQAWQNTGETFWILGPKNRVPAVYQFHRKA